jgi:hypothetical protein
MFCHTQQTLSNKSISQTNENHTFLESSRANAASERKTPASCVKVFDLRKTTTTISKLQESFDSRPTVD